MPHNGKPGSQNWCLAKAKSLAQGIKPVGLKASGPTQFSSTDIRVKKGELPPNLIETKCDGDPTPPPSISPTIIANITPPITPINPTVAPNTPTQATTTPSSATPTPTNVTTIPSSLPPPTPFPNQPTIPQSNFIEDAKLYFPVSYFIWKRKLLPPPINPIFPPWALFPKPRGKKVRSSSHLKWDRRLSDGTTYTFGVNDPCLGYSSHIVTLSEGTGTPQLKEDGSWAKYSHLLVPKTKLQFSPLNQNFKTSYHLKPRRGLSRPKSGQNTTHKGHGISHKDHLNGIGKQNPSENPCHKKYHISFSPQANTSSSTNKHQTISTTKQESLLHLPYPSTRTKWTRPLGGCLKGGGTSTPVTIKLIGSVPYNPQNDAQKLKINCLDSVIECPLSLIEHHSTLLKNILLENESCR